MSLIHVVSDFSDDEGTEDEDEGDEEAEEEENVIFKKILCSHFLKLLH